MPFGDGTGPYGTGPVGRRLGPCGAGIRGWFGRRFGWFWNRGLTKEEEKAMLEAQKRAIEQRLRELE